MQDVESHIQSVLQPFATKYGLSLSFIHQELGGTADLGKIGQLLIEPTQDSLEPSPHSKTDTVQYKVLAGTIVSVLSEKVEDLFVVPSVPSGNTDTRHYWGLTRNIFRFFLLTISS